MKKIRLLVMAVGMVLIACTPKPKPSNFQDFANNEKGAGLLVKYINNPKNPLKDRVDAILALMHHKWDIQILDAIDKSPDKAALAEALEEKLVPIYTNRLVGTNVAHAALLVSVAALAHLAFGDVNLELAAQLLIGSIPGALLGSRLSLWMPQKALRVTLVGLLLTSSIKLFV